MAGDEVPGVRGVLPSGAEAERRAMRLRQAEALRENLRKRREQRRARRAEEADEGDDSGTVPAPPPHIVDEEA